MPSHIYILVGRYADASRANELAVKADQSYITQCRVQGFYPLSYYPHNWHFLAMSSMMEGRSAVALNAARETAAAVPTDLSGVPVWGNPFPAVPLYAMARFGKWDDILAYPKPPQAMRFSRGIWHYARGLAWARRHKFAEAETALNSLVVTRQDPELQEYIAGANSAARQLEIADHVLRGELAAERKDYATGISFLRQAVALQDSLTYNEPEDWYFPVRHSLGAVLLAAGRPEQAEQVYRDDLKRNPENGWALFGLTASLKAQKKPVEAADAQRRFEKAWARADVKLKASRF
jgi:tetratricopeptide (TPR) repeat protein